MPPRRASSVAKRAADSRSADAKSQPENQKRKVAPDDAVSSSVASFASLYNDTIGSILPFFTQSELHQVLQVSKVFSAALPSVKRLNLARGLHAKTKPESLRGAIWSRVTCVFFQSNKSKNVVSLLNKLYEGYGVATQISDVGLPCNLNQAVANALAKFAPNITSLSPLCFGEKTAQKDGVDDDSDGEDGDDDNDDGEGDSNEELDWDDFCPVTDGLDLSMFPRLSSLHMDSLYDEQFPPFHQSGKYYQGIFNAVKKCPITELTFEFTSLTPADYENFLAPFPNLQRLTLHEIHGGDNGGDYAAVDFVTNSPAATLLTHLTIPSMMFDTRDEVKKLSALKNLTHLIIVGPKGSIMDLNGDGHEGEIFEEIEEEFKKSINENDLVVLPALKHFEAIEDCYDAGFHYPEGEFC